MGALEAYAWEWGSALIRWLHVTAAIAWIGGSFFFMHLDASLRKRAGDDPALAGVSWQVHGGGFYQMSKYLLAPSALPEELIWHKWQSYWTWISGFALLCWVYYGQSTYFLIDPAVMALQPWQAALIGVAALALGWIVYDLLCRSPHRLTTKNLLALVGFGYVVATSWVFTQFFSGRGALIHTGALMATIMTGNVFFVIMPNQRKSVAALLAGKKPDPKWVKTSKTRSTHNNYITLAGAVPDAVEPLPDDLLQSEGHPGDRHLRHRRRRAGPLFLQCLAPRSRPRAVVGLGGRGAWRSSAPSASRRPLRPACASSWGLPTCRQGSRAPMSQRRRRRSSTS